MNTFPRLNLECGPLKLSVSSSHLNTFKSVETNKQTKKNKTLNFPIQQILYVFGIWRISCSQNAFVWHDVFHPEKPLEEHHDEKRANEGIINEQGHSSAFMCC